MPVPSVAPALNYDDGEGEAYYAAAPVVGFVQPAVVEAVPVAQAAPPNLSDMVVVFKEQLGVSGTGIFEVIEQAADLLGVVHAERGLVEVARDCYDKVYG